MRFLVFIFTILGTQVMGQNYVDLAKLHFAQTPENDFDTLNGNTSIQEYGADITLPIVLKNENAFLTGLIYENIHLKLHPEAPTTSLTTINLKIGFNVNHSERLSASYLFLPKIASDMEELGSKDFQYGAVALFKLKKSESFKYHFGAYYNQELFGPFIVPLIGLYRMSDNGKIEINATLPVWADMNYSFNDWFAAGSSFAATVRSYHLSASNAYGVKKSNEIFGYLQVKLKKSVLIQTKLGYSIGRSYTAYADGDKTSLGISAFRLGDDRTELTPGFNDGLIFRFRLIYRFNIADSN